MFSFSFCFICMNFLLQNNQWLIRICPKPKLSFSTSHTLLNLLILLRLTIPISILTAIYIVLHFGKYIRSFLGSCFYEHYTNFMLDMSAAFYTFDHDILLQRLWPSTLDPWPSTLDPRPSTLHPQPSTRCCGLPPSCVTEYKPSLPMVKSQKSLVTSGVPQSSILWLIFLLYMADVALIA